MYAFRLWLLMVLLSTPVFAQPLMPRERPSRPSLNLQGLGLSEPQINQIRSLQDTDKIALEQLRKQVNQAQQELRDTFSADGPDAQVLQRYERVQKLQSQVNRLRIENILRIRKVLTPQQRQQLRGRFFEEGNQP